MNGTHPLKIFLTTLLTAVIVIAGYFLVIKRASFISISPTPSSLAVEYRNNSYGFSLTLPGNWKGYSVTNGKWQGNSTDSQSGDKPFTDGPLISIHNPKWTGLNTYQDIPIMVFTLEQWNQLQQEKYHIGAAPINPTELGRNSKYVFALPARYNYAFPPGYQEVDSIIQSKPLKTF